MTIAHIHVWDKKNKGDRAIVLAVKEQLGRIFQKAKIKDFSLEILKMPPEGREAQRALAAINRADIVVIGGGGIFYSYWLPFNAGFIKAIKKPIILFGVGYIREMGAPELSAASKRSAAFLAERSQAVGVRDFQTKRFLTAQGVPSAKMKVIGDPAALLKEKRPGREVLRKLALTGSQRRPRIGLNLNYSGWLGFGKWRNDILDSYRKTAEYFQSEYGARIYYLQHHPGEKNIHPALKISGLSVVNLPPAEQKYVYGRLDIVIGMMLHAGVMAFGAGTPELSVAYDLRNHGFAEYIGCPEMVMDLENLRDGGLERQAEKIFARRRAYKKKFFFIRQKIAEAQDKFLINL